MANIRLFPALAILGVIVGVSISHPGFADPALSLGHKATLQAVMQRHIERQSIDGVHQQLNLNSSDARRLHPAVVHPLAETRTEPHRGPRR